MVWRQACVAKPKLPQPIDFGWRQGLEGPSHYGCSENQYQIIVFPSSPVLAAHTAEHFGAHVERENCCVLGCGVAKDSTRMVYAIMSNDAKNHYGL